MGFDLKNEVVVISSGWDLDKMERMALENEIISLVYKATAELQADKARLDKLEKFLSNIDVVHVCKNKSRETSEVVVYNIFSEFLKIGPSTDLRQAIDQLEDSNGL